MEKSDDSPKRNGGRQRRAEVQPRPGSGARLKDVAREAGVHPGTVSRALDPRKMQLVRPETRAQVQAVARKLGYRADEVARSLRRGQTTTVGVPVADLGNPIIAPVLRGMSTTLELHGFTMLISETQDDHERLRTSLEKPARPSRGRDYHHGGTAR